MTEIMETRTGWSSLCGHAMQAQWLRHAIASRRVPHALILTGPRQVGKTTVARVMTRSLLCAESDEGSGCGKCASCLALARGGHPDFEGYRPVLIRDRSHAADSESVERAGGGPSRRWDEAPEQMVAAVLPIDLMRPMRERASRRPVMGRRKVILIEGADQLTDDAQDAILKTIEEPIAGLTLLLVAENLARLHVTVRSRCWTMAFSPVDAGRIETWLVDQFQAKGAVASRISGSASGRPGAAWRRLKGPALMEIDSRIHAFAAAVNAVERVSALRFSEQFERLARELLEAECGTDPRPVSLSSATHASKIQRSGSIRLLDELALRLREKHDAAGLDAVFQAKHHLLQNANIRLSLDVLFLRLATRN